jgi:AraC-like DNA-binding protein
VEAHKRAVERVITAMHERVGEPLSLQELAEIAIISPFHFDRVFQRITGVPPCQFLGALRLQAAKRLLLTTTLTVTDVCFEVGYNSLGTFTSRFTQLVGLPPRRLRQMAKERPNPYMRMLRERREPVGATVEKGAAVEGRLNLAGVEPGPIFIGLFRSRLPQSSPASCTVVTETGTYSMGHVADGKYHLFASAFTWSEDPITYLLPEADAVRIGMSEGAVLVKSGKVSGTIDVNLRPPDITDPPLLTALPYLVSRHFSRKIDTGKQPGSAQVNVSTVKESQGSYAAGASGASGL